MSFATLEKTVWIDIDKEDIERVDRDGEVTKEVTIDVDLFEFDDEDIRAEYFERFCVELEEQDWRRLYEQRRTLPVEDFLKIIDNIIMDNSGRVL
jgi:hypothetical protein